MDLGFLRAHDSAKIALPFEATQTLPGIVFDFFEKLLEIADCLKLSPKNKFLTRTVYLRYLMGTTDVQMNQDELFKVTLSCIYFTIQIAGTSGQYAKLMQFIANTQYADYYTSEEHQHFSGGLNSSVNADYLMASPYDFVDLAKDYVSVAKFQRQAKMMIDFAIALPYTANNSAEEIFVACCMFICDRKYNQSLDDLIESKFQTSIGSSCEVKTMLAQAFETVFNDLFS